MQGHFDIGAYHTPGLTPEKLETLLGPVELRKPGCVLDLLAQYEKRQEVRGANLVFDHFAEMNLWELFNGPAVPNPYNYGGGFSLVALTTHDAEPTYQEDYGNNFVNGNNLNGTVGTGAGKRFYEDQIEPHLIAEDLGGKEAIFFRTRWLWLPAEAVSSNVKSITTWTRQINTAASTSSWANIVSRIRLKDSGGNPITINKTASITLFVEYTVTLTSI
ncbi:MAG: hypothetical protein ACYTEQ_23145 [Planctomycetota bacterium]|jgi:hypothetical protein